MLVLVENTGHAAPSIGGPASSDFSDLIELQPRTQSHIADHPTHEHPAAIEPERTGVGLRLRFGNRWVPPRRDSRSHRWTTYRPAVVSEGLRFRHWSGLLVRPARGRIVNSARVRAGIHFAGEVRHRFVRRQRTVQFFSDEAVGTHLHCLFNRSRAWRYCVAVAPAAY